MTWACVCVATAAGAFFVVQSSGTGSGSQSLGSAPTRNYTFTNISWNANLQPGQNSPLTFNIENHNSAPVTINHLSFDVSDSALSGTCQALLSQSISISLPAGPNLANGATLWPTSDTAQTGSFNSTSPPGQNHGTDYFTNGYTVAANTIIPPGGSYPWGTNQVPTINFVDTGTDQSCLENANVTLTINGAQ